jgi:hypothetical protein
MYSTAPCQGSQYSLPRPVEALLTGEQAGAFEEESSAPNFKSPRAVSRGSGSTAAAIISGAVPSCRSWDGDKYHILFGILA